MKKNQQISTKNALINLYLNLKHCYFSKGDQKIEEDIENLSSKNELNLIKYIKDSIDAIILNLAEKKINEYNNKYTGQNIQEDYESMLIKYEKDIRGHIKTEHQLKLYADSLQSNIEDLEKEKKELKYNNNYRDIIIKKDDEINNLKKEINYNKKIIKTYEEKNNKLLDNEKKFKNLLLKIEKKYKNEIESLNKKIKYYHEQLKNAYCIEGEKEKKNETMYCNSSRAPINSNLINNYIDNESMHNMNRIYRNLNNSISISNNHSTSMVNSRPYEKIEKYLLNKYPKAGNKDQYQYQNKIKNLKNNSIENNKEKHYRNSSINNIPNNSYIIDSKVQDELMSKYLINDSSLNNTIKKRKKGCNRHNSVENNNNKYIKSKQMSIIKKILMSNNNTNNNSVKRGKKENSKGIYSSNMHSNNISSKKFTGSNNSSTVNSSKNYLNKTNKEIFSDNISNIIGGKNNIGCNFVNNINIYSNNVKQDNANIYISNNLKKYSNNSSIKDIMNNNNLNSSNYIHVHGNKNQLINYRNKQKDGKISSSYTNSVQKNY